jgi:hypothetical protein
VVRNDVKIMVTLRALTKNGPTTENNPKDTGGQAQISDAFAEDSI